MCRGMCEESMELGVEIKRASDFLSSVLLTISAL